ncbi:hypothetical protein FS749_003225 [Ceratobasidium sp. UAMH 11750]|nr:hypothetical protein FS749_003225 [Ceratobasidium sp. UAMH 11750]
MSRVTEIDTPSELNEVISGITTAGLPSALTASPEVGERSFVSSLRYDAGIAFKDHRYSFDDHNAQAKSSEITKLNPLKSLPVVEINGAKYSQSYFILRLWARQLDKYDGKTNLERYYVDAMTDIASDWRTKCKYPFAFRFTRFKCVFVGVVDSAFRATDNGFGAKGDQKELDYHKSFTVPKYASTLNAH